MSKIVAIVSGGMDSITLVHYLKKRYPADLHLLSFNYGQRHLKELDFAHKCAEELGTEWDVVDLFHIRRLLAGSGSVLVDHTKEVPEGHYAEESMKATVVPNRNAIMLSIATGVAVAEHADFVAIGVHAGDHFIYPDCRPGFITAMSIALGNGNLGFAKEGFRVIAPFVEMTKAEIVRLGSLYEVDYSKTWSCYKGGAIHCGKCGTCVERREAFKLAELEDPTEYEDEVQSLR